MKKLQQTMDKITTLISSILCAALMIAFPQLITLPTALMRV